MLAFDSWFWRGPREALFSSRSSVPRVSVLHWVEIRVLIYNSCVDLQFVICVFAAADDDHKRLIMIRKR